LIRKPRFWLINRIIVSFALESDGWFTGLVFDPQGRAIHGGYVCAARRTRRRERRISAGIARFLIENGANLK
jgi:hypothetical protein